MGFQNLSDSLTMEHQFVVLFVEVLVVFVEVDQSLVQRPTEQL